MIKNIDLCQFSGKKTNMQAFCSVKCQKNSVPINSAPLKRLIIQTRFFMQITQKFAPHTDIFLIDYSLIKLLSLSGRPEVSSI